MQADAGAVQPRASAARRAVMHALVGRAAALAQDADAVHDGIDAVEQRHPARRLGEILEAAMRAAAWRRGVRRGRIRRRLPMTTSWPRATSAATT